ncbi:MAG: HD domain-containing protein [Chloroflexi bacterium]|nr:MAG: HD domain-containing protein [Chloroflexota bacterium]
MTVPGRVDAAALLLSLDPPAWFLRHSQAVAEVASWLAERIEFAGVPVDRALVEAAALLHDVDKLLPSDDRATQLPHGEGSADWLARQGHPELGRAVANHPVTKLVDGEAFRRWAAFATREERVVCYADKRAGQRLESMDERFADWSRRHPDRPGGDEPSWSGELARDVRARAARLEADVCGAANVTPEEVGRAPWTAKALQAARGRVAKRR